jgi:5'-methylthioadenosine phosphorylase
MCYVSLAAVTDYDCWHENTAQVTVEMVMQNLSKNVENAKKILAAAIKAMSSAHGCGCKEALKYAIVTDKKLIPPKVRKDLDIIIGPYVQ